MLRPRYLWMPVGGRWTVESRAAPFAWIRETDSGRSETPAAGSSPSSSSPASRYDEPARLRSTSTSACSAIARRSVSSVSPPIAYVSEPFGPRSLIEPKALSERLRPDRHVGAPHARGIARPLFARPDPSQRTWAQPHASENPVLRFPAPQRSDRTSEDRVLGMAVGGGTQAHEPIASGKQSSSLKTARSPSSSRNPALSALFFPLRGSETTTSGSLPQKDRATCAEPSSTDRCGSPPASSRPAGGTVPCTSSALAPAWYLRDVATKTVSTPDSTPPVRHVPCRCVGGQRFDLSSQAPHQLGRRSCSRRPSSSAAHASAASPSPEPRAARAAGRSLNVRGSSGCPPRCSRGTRPSALPTAAGPEWPRLRRRSPASVPSTA